jgi:hypothetical protein
MNSPVTLVTSLGHIDEQSSRDSSFGGKLVVRQFGTFSTASVRLGSGDECVWSPFIRSLS